MRGETAWGVGCHMLGERCWGGEISQGTRDECEMPRPKAQSTQLSESIPPGGRVRHDADNVTGINDTFSYGPSRV